MDHGQQNRRYSRVKWGERARVTVGDAEASGPVMDISLNGVLVQADLAVTTGTACEVVIPLGEAPEHAIEAEGHVVRRDSQGLAIHFDAMELDSVAHLRQLVTYNSDDPDRIDREAVHLRLREEGAGED
jgi:hypothetical protein